MRNSVTPSGGSNRHRSGTVPRTDTVPLSVRDPRRAHACLWLAGTDWRGPAWAGPASDPSVRPCKIQIGLTRETRGTVGTRAARSQAVRVGSRAGGTLVKDERGRAPFADFKFKFVCNSLLSQLFARKEPSLPVGVHCGSDPVFFWSAHRNFMAASHDEDLDFLKEESKIHVSLRNQSQNKM
jgi:hypothetical protein